MTPLSDEYFRLPAGPALVRWSACTLFLGLILWIGSGVVRHAFAETVLYVGANYPIAPDALTVAYRMDPENPRTVHALAVYDMDVVRDPDYDQAARLLGEAIALAPARIDLYVDLGRNRELVGRVDEAEECYKRAAVLAPGNWKPQWALGNLYLRDGRLDDAATALQLASDRNPDMKPLAIRTAWRASNGEVAFTDKVAGSSLDGQATLLLLLLEQNRTADAFSLWNKLATEFPSDPALVGYGTRLASMLLGAGRSEDALRIWSLIEPGTDRGFDRIGNSGFDEPIPAKAVSPFDWSLTQSDIARISLDAGRSGGKSLRVDYSVRGGDSLSHASEYVRVHPGMNYTLTFSARTVDLQSGGLPYVGVSDAANRDAMRSFVSVPSGTSDWTELKLVFRAPASGIVAVTIGRASCGDVCPIFGTIWVDDFSLAAN